MNTVLAVAPLFLVALGGALGSAARYLLSRQVAAWLGSGFPWGTLAVNVLGGLSMGLLVGALAARPVAGPELRTFLGAGILGGFTTFSAFSLEVVELVGQGAVGAASVYVAASVLASVGALGVGLVCARLWLP